jgi:hypothetical protein
VRLRELRGLDLVFLSGLQIRPPDPRPAGEWRPAASRHQNLLARPRYPSPDADRRSLLAATSARCGNFRVWTSCVRLGIYMPKIDYLSI